MYLFELQFCLDICPGVGLLDHMVTLFLVFWGILRLFSAVAPPTYLPTDIPATLFQTTGGRRLLGPLLYSRPFEGAQWGNRSTNSCELAFWSHFTDERTEFKRVMCFVQGHWTNESASLVCSTSRMDPKSTTTWVKCTDVILSKRNQAKYTYWVTLWFHSRKV